MENVKLTNGQRKIVEPRLISNVPLDDSILTNEQMQTISLPVRFRYHNGGITELYFAENDVAWSENIKRSVLNMLQLNLYPTEIDLMEKANKNFVTMEVVFYNNLSRFFQLVGSYL